jgi:predicted dehydrogenase
VSQPPVRVGIVGCGLIGRKRAQALRPEDQLVGCTDVVPEAAASVAADFGGQSCTELEQLLDLDPDVVVVATSHDRLAALADQALVAGAHVLVEKPAGMGSAQVQRLRETAAQMGRLVKVGFNHRFHPAIARLSEEVGSGDHGELMHLRGRYGHGGRPAYDREWRAVPSQSGGGELIDQGMHLLDLVHWLVGPLPLHAALLRTHFWDTEVEDNAALLLGSPDSRAAPWAMLHVSWTEWKNTFSLEVYLRQAKLQVDGLVHSYGTQTLRIYRMSPDLGPPALEEITFPDNDRSWTEEWKHFTAVMAGEMPLLGSLDDALYAWEVVEAAYARSSYGALRETVSARRAF